MSSPGVVVALSDRAFGTFNIFLAVTASAIIVTFAAVVAAATVLAA
jgi:hypothetical protein